MWLAGRSLNLPLFSIAFLGMVVSWSAVSTALQAVIRDIAQEDQIPFASAWSACTFTFGCTASFLVAFWVRDQYRWQYAFCICSALIAAAVFFPMAKEPPLHDRPPLIPCDGVGLIKQSFYFNFQRHPEFGILLLTKVILAGISVSKTFNVYFIRDAFNVTDEGELVTKVATISLGCEIVASIVTFFITCFHVRPLCFAILGAIITALSWLLLIPVGFDASLYNALELYGMVYGIGAGFLCVADQALTLQYIPDKNNASRYTGLSSVANFIGGVAFSLVDVLLLTLFGRTCTWTLPGPRASPVVGNEDYRLEGFVAVFVFNALMSVIWAFLYFWLGNQKKNEGCRECWYSVTD
jgi:hypothetical protein